MDDNKNMSSKIKEILEKDELTDEEVQILSKSDPFADFWKEKADTEMKTYSAFEEEYRKKHPTLPDPEWW